MAAGVLASYTTSHHRQRYCLCKINWFLSSIKDCNYMRLLNVEKLNFIHAKPWIPSHGDKSIFTVVIHLWISPLHQLVRARTIDEYDITIMPVPHVSVTSQINCGDVTMLSQKDRPCDNCEMSDRWFVLAELCVQDKWPVRNKYYIRYHEYWFWVTRNAICQWFSLVTSSLVKIIGKSPHSWPKNRCSR